MFPIIRDFLPSDIGPAVRLLEECRGLPDTKSVDIAQFVNDVSSGAPGVVAIESERIVGIVQARTVADDAWIKCCVHVHGKDIRGTVFELASGM